jgi:hypothetical protein
MTWPIRRGARSLLVAAFSFALGVAAANAEQPACGQFALSPKGKVDLFAGYLPVFESGNVLPTDGVFAVTLRPAARVVYPYKSGHDHDRGFGGVVTIESTLEGRHRIALSGEAELDVAQGDSLLRPLAVGYDPECPGVHRIVDIVSDGGALTVQISGARTSLITIAVFRLWLAQAADPD